jgi:hypothetical protein
VTGALLLPSPLPPPHAASASAIPAKAANSDPRKNPFTTAPPCPWQLRHSWIRLRDFPYSFELLQLFQMPVLIEPLYYDDFIPNSLAWTSAFNYYPAAKYLRFRFALLGGY